MILSDILSTSIQERVSILNADTLEPIFQSAHPMRVAVMEAKRATKFAVEDGTERSDHVVRELTEISIDFFLSDDTRNEFDRIRQAYNDNVLVTVQTKVATYESMIILAVPHDETVELGNSINIPIRLQEWLSVKPEEGIAPERPKQKSTVKGGQKQTTKASSQQEDKVKGASKGSILSGVFK